VRVFSHRCLSLRYASSGSDRGGSRKLKNPLSLRRTGAKRFNFRCPRCHNIYQAWSNRYNFLKNAKRARENFNLVVSFFCKPSRMFRAPAAFSSRPRTGKIHAGSTGQTAREEGRFVSEVQRILRRHISRITRAWTCFTRKCGQNRTNGREGTGWLRGRVGECKVTYITFPVYGPIRS